MHPKDFRYKPFSDVSIIIDSGKYAGNRFYYKLFVIENLIRIIINTIMINDYPLRDWWAHAVDGGIKKSWHRRSRHHGIYHVFLKDLNTIIINNRIFIETYISDLDDLILTIENFNDTRRKIAHTKYLNTVDLNQLDKLYNLTKRLTIELSSHLTIVIP